MTVIGEWIKFCKLKYDPKEGNFNYIRILIENALYVKAIDEKAK